MGRWLAALLLALAVSTAAYVLFSSLMAHSDALENEATYRSDIHRENASYHILWVCKAASSEQACIDEARQTARENEREEQGLAAQKVTAWWTKTMGIAALIGMALSAAGVWLVKTTFDETRRANIIALAQSAHEIGPKIIVEKATVTVLRGYLMVELIICNLGDGHASSLRGEGVYKVWSDIRDRFSFGNRRHRAKAFRPRQISGQGRTTLTIYWNGSGKSARKRQDRIIECFANGNRPGMDFDITVKWDTPFYSGFRAKVKFGVDKLATEDVDGEHRGKVEVGDIQQFALSIG